MRPISWHTSCLDVENFNDSLVLMFLFYIEITNWEYIKSVVGGLSTLLQHLARSGYFAWYTCNFSHHHPENVVKHIFQMGVSTNTLWCLLGVLAWCLLPSCGFCTFCQVCLIAVWRRCLEFEKTHWRKRQINIAATILGMIPKKKPLTSEQWPKLQLFSGK